MLAHNDDGALGLVLNRPSEVEVGAVLPEGWSEVAPQPQVLFVGGPVAPDSVIGLACRRRGRGLRADDRGPGNGRPRAHAHSIGHGVSVSRIFAGHAGWGPGQLEGELMVPGWIVVDAEDGDAFTDDPDGLWRAVLGASTGAARVARELP